MTVSPTGDPVERARRLLLDGGPDLLGSAGPFEVTVVATEERPDSTLRRIRLADGLRSRSFYLKTLRTTPATRPGQLAAVTAEHRVLVDLHERFASLAPLSVVKPVACLPESFSLLTEEAAGRGLNLLLSSPNPIRPDGRLRRHTDLCRLAGAWLRHFHAMTAPPAGGRYDVSEIFGYCEERLRLMLSQPGGGLDLDTALALERHVRRLASRVTAPELELVGRHNDFRPENVVTDGRSLTLLDFTGFTYGPRLYDFMKFWLRLENLSQGLLPRRRRAAALQAAFHEGYGPAVDPRSPLADLLRVAYAIDKISEAVDPTLPRPPWSRRLVMANWYRSQRQWLWRVAQGDSP
ncbi:MAG: phosphotransferase [Candidatus Rokuibacteriota bacterium]